jgi:hypothetical protein
MAKVSVAQLIESAVFNDAECAGVSVWVMFEKKFNELFEGNPEFLDSIEKEGIRSPIMYQPEENKVYEGHHRILIAWLLNIEFIEYTTEWYVAFDENEICLFD